MSALEIIETTFKQLQHRTDAAIEGVQHVDRLNTKTISGMNNVVDAIKELREKVNFDFLVQSRWYFSEVTNHPFILFCRGRTNANG